jgi:hypothetical protein
MRTGKSSSEGFTLMETMVAVLVLMAGVLGLAAMLGNSLAYMDMAQYDYIAQQKAAEAVESIFTARDIGQASWDTICNVGSSVCPAGIFMANPMQLCDPGPDGIVGTADDDCTHPDALLMPNTSGNFNPPVRMPLSTFTRTITITNAVTAAGATIPNLLQIQVTITYTTAGHFRRTYTMTSNISNFS